MKQDSLNELTLNLLLFKRVRAVCITGLTIIIISIKKGHVDYSGRYANQWSTDVANATEAAARYAIGLTGSKPSHPIKDWILSSRLHLILVFTDQHLVWPRHLCILRHQPMCWLCFHSLVVTYFSSPLSKGSDKTWLHVYMSFRW